jgi:hypothetical protein
MKTHEPKKELSPEDDVKNVMAQIKAMESGAQKPAGGEVPTTSATPVPTTAEVGAPPPVVSPPATQAPPSAPKAPDWLHSIAEVTSKDSRHFGVLFRLGDIQGGKAHGYLLKEHGGREYITVPSDHITIVGKAKVKAGRCCSGQWVAEHREVK